jgi:regulator of sirC expression with transglutaminase-like and TPR domain
MVGIGMPGHFLIRPDVEEMEIFVDAFNQGEILFLQDCKDRLNQLFGQPVELQPAFFQAVAPRQFLARMLTNLKVIYLERGNLHKALAAIERILLLFPNAPMELRDRGVLYYHLDRFTEARQDLEDYLTFSPTAEDASIIRELLESIDRGGS